MNAARYLSGEEPTEVVARVTSTSGDPRFTEVEEQVDFILKFPSGLVATGTSSYGFHDNKHFRLSSVKGWAELDPAFPYRGQTMRVARTVKGSGDDAEVIETRRLDAKNQFALELDHLATCIKDGAVPHTPGEEGLQDVRIMMALYESARAGKPVALPASKRLDAYRGPAPRS